MTIRGGKDIYIGFMDNSNTCEWKDIYFKQGPPEIEANLSDIDLYYNNIVVLDDLMDMAMDSPIISKLFTQGGQRNPSVILLLQRKVQHQYKP